jgi:two-component system phosphate regulon sensor histidine kinase PhoR
MTRRAIELLILVLLGSVWGLAQDSAGWTLAGALLGGVIWSVFDGLRVYRLLHWLNKPDTDELPRVSGLWAEVLDRSRKLIRKLEKKASNADARLEDFLSAIRSSPNGVVLLDAQARIEWSNLTAADHLGFDAQRDVGNYIRNLVRHPGFTAYLSSGDFSHEIEIEAPHSLPTQSRQISVQVHPYGKKRKLVLSRDVTAVQLAETMRRDFVANVSHEIRTPLTVLSGFVETMQTLPLSDAERAQYLSMMSQQASRMQTLVSDLLTLSRIEGSPAPGLGDWMDARELLAHVHQEALGLSQTLGSVMHDITLHESEPVWVAGSKTEILSAMSNLMSNAVRYTPAGGRIQLGWRLLDEGSAVFSVTDSGPGISPEHIPRLTERFYRVDRSRSRESGGTGLGLAIVKHVVQRHGGQLQIDSELGRGSTFAIVWPAGRVKS